jgi:hypothetical protein
LLLASISARLPILFTDIRAVSSLNAGQFPSGFSGKDQGVAMSTQTHLALLEERLTCIENCIDETLLESNHTTLRSPEFESGAYTQYFGSDLLRIS